MPRQSPDHTDAELVFRAYELRREPVLREARTAMNERFWPKSFEELMEFAKRDHPLGKAFSQVTAYWEMVFSLARHGVVNADFLVESSGEGIFLFVKVRPFLAPFRAAGNQRAFANAEWVSENSELGREMTAAMAKSVAARLAAT